MLDTVVVRRSKFELGSEQKMERLWREAQAAGWPFWKFCEHVACMLVVFECRDRAEKGLAKQAERAKPKGKQSKKKRANVAR